jgi:uncharacterized BrkB/YihY/UPF0761 family membrane protein
MDPAMQIIQGRLAHEDDLINQRISWLVSSQSFLLSAYAITLNGITGVQGHPHGAVQEKLISFLPMVGIACVILVAVAMVGGLYAIKDLRQLAVQRFPKDLFYLVCKRKWQLLGVSAPALIPLVFLLIWMAILTAEKGKRGERIQNPESRIQEPGVRSQGAS